VPAFDRSADPKPNANIANTITTDFFHMIGVPSVVCWPIEPNNHREVSKEREVEGL
jgi:hypothetical protein